MKYLRKFETASEIQSWQISGEHATPNVVLSSDTGDIQYNVPKTLGVYIQHIDGNLYTTDDWTAGGFANEVANGVAVITDNAGFVIAKESLGTMAWSSNTSNAVEGVMLTSDSATAKTDYAGAANTALIAAIDTGKAAYSCANFTFPNGAKGYLPALGEWAEAYAHKADINAAMTLIGGSAISNDYHWSSTQYSAVRAWNLYWGNGFASYDTKDYSNSVRAFSAL